MCYRRKCRENDVSEKKLTHFSLRRLKQCVDITSDFFLASHTSEANRVSKSILIEQNIDTDYSTVYASLVHMEGV